jgi:hypothetical protein
MKLSLLVAAALVLLVACSSSPPPPPKPIVPIDADDRGDYPDGDGAIEEHPEGSLAAFSSPCGKACEQLRAILCSDGFARAGVTCYRACLSMAHHTRVPTGCWIMSKSIADARACGGIRCLER